MDPLLQTSVHAALRADFADYLPGPLNHLRVTERHRARGVVTLREALSLMFGADPRSRAHHVQPAPMLPPL